MDSIRIRGARTHNLKNLSLELPRNRLVVITGLSGSGKSSLALPEDTRLRILAPVIARRKGEQAELLDELRAQGFTRVRVDGKVHELDAAPRLSKNVKHSVDVVIDRLRVRADAKQRLAESFETALRHADGRALVVETDSGKEHLFSAKFS